MTGTGRVVEHVTCLGCGCGCDDIAVTLSEGRITEVTPVCPVGRAWFGDGSVPLEIQRSGRPASLDQAVADAAELLLGARGQVLVYIGPDLTSQAQRQAVALADLLAATVDSTTSATAAEGLLAGQRRGRAGATLGEVRNRADVLLFWGMDPASRYPRFMARYVDPAGTHVPEGRGGRILIGVGVGSDPAPRGVDLTLTLDPGEEIAALSLMRASVQGDAREQRSPGLTQAMAIADRLAKARYAVLAHDAEPGDEPRNPLRVEALIALTQALNGPTRAALISLRAGGNRVGAETVLTWQTGYPFSVDYSRGHPHYDPGERGMGRLAADRFRAGLVVGSPALDGSLSGTLGRMSTVAIGPRASQAPFATRVAIDTGVAGIHEAGTAYRMDEVPLQLRPPLDGPRSATEVLRTLTVAVRAGLGQGRS
jgi:formylmethanofuran dehydrogenase subunit B